VYKPTPTRLWVARCGSTRHHQPVLLVWAQFSLSVVLIWLAGVRLSRYGDVIAEKMGLTRGWIGLILLATVTSLPELVTGISAVSLANAPNIALGDALGSCVFNLLIITALDFLQRGEPMFTRTSQGHILSAGFGVILIGFVGFTLLLNSHGAAPALGHIGFSTPIIVVLYVVAMRTVFRYEQRQRAEYTEETVELYPDVRLRQAATGYALAALVVVATGVFLPFIGEQLATAMGWQKTFVGTLFVAFATSVPELVVTIAALRIGALDMAIANLFGSNLFDMAIIAVDDVFFRRGPLLAHVSPLHAVSSFSAVMMTGVAIVGLLYRPKTRLFRTVGWASLLLFSLYLLNTYVLYLYGE
jgi:cation:H+ antiporter